MAILFFLVLAVLFLAYANGANDNIKGVATLIGSGTTGYRTALVWATGTTFLGSLAALLLAGRLIHAFRGKGLVADTLSGSPEFLLAVALGAAVTVLLATLFGFPVSTTHALTGGLIGAGLVAVSLGISTLHLGALGAMFVLPLLLSPVLAVLLTFPLYRIFRAVRVKFGIRKELCLCLGREVVAAVPYGTGPGEANLYSVDSFPAMLRASVGSEAVCRARYVGSFLGMSCEKILDSMHFLSSGAVSFARGLNDTPKIVALLLAANVLDLRVSALAVGAAIAIGGLLNARRVARTMSERITEMNHGQGFTANLVTSLLVIFASCVGLPVSTTHVACGALFGIGVATGRANARTIGVILLAWITTLPMAAILSGLVFWLCIAE